MIKVLIVIWFICIILIACSTGRTNKGRNPDDYEEINERINRRELDAVKRQEKYDNDWGTL